MGKEAKIGLGIIAILAIVLGVVVFRKVSGSNDLPDAAVENPADDSSESGDGKSGVGDATVISASGGTKNGDSDPFGNDEQGSRQWVGSADQFNDRPENRNSGQPRPELMPRTGSSFDSGTPNSLRTNSHSGGRFGDSGLQQREDFGTGRTNVLRPGTNDGALNSSSRRQVSDVDAWQTDPNPGGLRPTRLAQLQPGPDAIQIAAQSADTQAQNAAQQQTTYGASKAQTQYGFAGAATAQQIASGDGYSTASNSGAATSRYGATTYGSNSFGTSSYSSPGGAAVAGDEIATKGDLSQNTGSYVVKPNDSFWSVSKKVYGSGDFYKALIEHNRKKFPDSSKIRVGDVIATPAVANLRKNYPVFCPKERKATSNPYRTTALRATQSRGQRVYVVQEGDTIFNIARDELGKTARWADICELNRDLLGDDYDHLKPGWKLVLPGRGTTASPAVGPAVDAQRQDSLTRRIWSKIE